MPGKRIHLDDETFAVLDLLARAHDDLPRTDKAFRDLLRKHKRPNGLNEALRKIVGASTAVAPFKGSAKEQGRGKKAAKKKARSSGTTILSGNDRKFMSEF